MSNQALDDFFSNPHYSASYKDSTVEDVDFLPELLEGSEALDSNGSETLNYWHDMEYFKIHVTFNAYDREFKNGLVYAERIYELIGTIKPIKNELGLWDYFNVESFKIISTVEQY